MLQQQQKILRKKNISAGVLDSINDTDGFIV